MIKDFKFTEKCTDDWHHGEVDAVNGVEPYPVPESVFDPTAYGAGYHLAYKKIHGRDWHVKAPANLPGNAIVALGGVWPPSPSHINAAALRHWFYQQIVKVAKDEHGLALVQDVISQAHFCLAYPQHCSSPISAGGVVYLRDKTGETDTLGVRVDHLKGEYDLRPQIEAMIPELRKHCEALAARRERHSRRLVIATALQDELSRVLQAKVVIPVSSLDSTEVTGNAYISLPALDEAGVHKMISALKSVA